MENSQCELVQAFGYYEVHTLQVMFYFVFFFSLLGVLSFT